MATTVRRSTLTLPAAPLGPENPLPALLAPRELHAPEAFDEAESTALPPAMARRLAYGHLRTLLPVPRLDGYTRERTPTALDTLVIENDRLRATVLPGLGGRLYSLHHKPTGRELLHANPVLQFADFGLAGAWFSGGVEWNPGATGHTTMTCAPMHAARVTAPDGGEMLRLWEWERLRDLPYQVDLWLPDGSDFLYAGVRVRNPHHRTVPLYWWSNTAVPETPGTRVLAPAGHAWHFGSNRTLHRVPVPDEPIASEHPADWFYDLADGARPWIAALGADGRGLIQTSTDTLCGRKLFVWGRGRGGRRWQRWLAGDTGEARADGYLEIQAGLAPTQLEHLPLIAGGAVSWLEAYGPLDTAPDAGTDTVEAHLEAVLPRERVRAAYEAWLPAADAAPDPGAPEDILATGSGWGALEVLRGRYDLPGTPFDPGTMGEQQKPWLELLLAGVFPKAPGDDALPGPALVSPEWRELLETAGTYDGNEWYLDHHLGLAQWDAGDRAQAVRSWERSAARTGSWLPLHCLAAADRADGNQARAAERYLAAVRAQAAGTCPEGVRAALAREAVPALLEAGRPGDAAAVLGALPDDVLARGRFRLLHAQVLAAQGDIAGARAVFDAGFTVDDLREGEDSLHLTWQSLTGGAEPLPESYDFRMAP
ncbi:DUF5107 domain-containing protein [Streptomyces sp. NPDC088732]|uniref:DUF5107 domain-containing protein n=1 Tax=Streptomyces sp. NPDC088732 TaxID=3365879 RepID=UPI0037FC367F